MRLSTAPAIVVCSGYKPEPPRNNRALSVLGIVIGVAVIYYASGLIGAGWVELIKEISQ